MTIEIKDLYDDIMDLFFSVGSADLGVGSIDWGVLDNRNFTGTYESNQVVDNELLIYMFNLLMEVAQAFEKETEQETYAINKLYVYNTGWRGFTYAQELERLEFELDGYLRRYSPELAGDNSLNLNNWLVDENGDFQKRNSYTYVIFNDGYGFSGYYRKTKDTWRLSDLADWSKFYDPSIVATETIVQLNNWLGEFSKAIEKLKNSVPKISKRHSELRYPTWGGYVAFESNSSREVNTISTYHEDGWYDYINFEYIYFVRQDIEIGDSISFSVYSTTGDGTYPTTDPTTGISFGADASELMQYARDNFTDDYDSFPQYSYTPTIVDVYGTDYTNEDYTDNLVRDSIKLSVTSEYEERYTSLEFENQGIYDSIVFATDEDAPDSNPEEYVVIKDFEKDPSIVGVRIPVSEEIIDVVLALPDYPAVGNKSYDINNAHIKNINDSNFTIHTLSPPE